MTNCTKEPQNDVVKPKNGAIDLISRQAAIKAIESRQTEQWIDSDVDYNNGLETALCEINALPSSERTGKWIKRFDGNEWFWCCSACKEQWYEDDLYMGGNEFPNFCPNCGSYNGGE